ncbi:3-isopropylmalate/(R)-2-methylmalate dehydratase small subunit [Anaerospora hongkongensis]|uniref:3-isopropylmalate dehydratase small subunit n=1 Tax=Anaerospora hongkongensis TaxID=244830 RepID=A0A4R1Q491_9FIRM|nr:3-isopropylmalate dehydratase [Anaerospora hongkongensis]TCL38862.1 3-isopropylmalate/(R)-2-methylmalate dehydratase small subunit [Anaerospora hongkongensis]
MINVVEGRVWKFGDDLSTDLMMPASVMHGKVPKEKMKDHCMEANRPEFASSVVPGDILVAGKNCGCGSSRPASDRLKELGLSCIIAESFSAIFFRNSVSIGLPAIEVKGIAEFLADGDKAKVDFAAGSITNITTGKTLPFAPFPEEFSNLLSCGGVINLLKKEKEQGI